MVVLVNISNPIWVDETEYKLTTGGIEKTRSVFRVQNPLILLTYENDVYDERIEDWI